MSHQSIARFHEQIAQFSMSYQSRLITFNLLNMCATQTPFKMVETTQSFLECSKVFSVVYCCRNSSLCIKNVPGGAVVVAWYPAQRKSAWYTLMRFRLIKNGVAHVYDVHTV